MLNQPSMQKSIFYFFLFVAAITLVVMFKVELPLLLGMNPDWDHKIDHYRWPLHIHAFFGSVALFAAPIQFFSRFRETHLPLHRLLGRAYAVSILIAAPIGIYIALLHLSGYEKWATVLQGLIWLVASAIAVYTALGKRVAMHQIWIARSYALTLTFVLSRFIIDVLKIQISPAIGGSGGLILISTVLVILFADAMGRGKFNLRARTIRH